MEFFINFFEFNFKNVWFLIGFYFDIRLFILIDRIGVVYSIKINKYTYFSVNIERKFMWNVHILMKNRKQQYI